MRSFPACAQCGCSILVDSYEDTVIALIFCNKSCQKAYGDNKPSKREYGSYSCRCCGYQTNNHAALQEHIKQSPRGCSEAYT